MSESIAVIIPSYNRRHSLGRALDSVFCQTTLPDEVCVIDDGSSDGTEEFVRENYPRVSYHYQENRGVSSARNTGIYKTTGEWLAFLDSDDEWLPDKLQRQLVETRSHTDYKIVHCDEKWIRNGVRVNQMDKHQKAGGFIFERCLPLCAISPSAVMLTRDLLVEMGGFDEDFPACEDYDLWLRVCSRYPVLYIDEPLLNKYGGHDDQLSRRHWGMDRYRVKALEKLLVSATLNHEQFQAAQAMLLFKCAILINGAIKRGNEETASYYQEILNRYQLAETNQ